MNEYIKREENEMQKAEISRLIHALRNKKWTDTEIIELILEIEEDKMSASAAPDTLNAE